MPLSAVVTSSTTSATNNNTKYSSTSFGGRLTPPSVFDNQLTHNEDDLSAKYDLDKVSDIFKPRKFWKFCNEKQETVWNVLFTNIF